MSALSKKAQELEQVARTFAREHLWDSAAQRESDHDIDRGIVEELGKQRLLGVNVPSELGGLAAGAESYVAVMRQLAMADSAVAVTTAVTNMVSELIAAHGTEWQRNTYVPDLVEGRSFGGAFGLSEPEAGSDAASMRTKAERVGELFVLSGQKMWITTGDRASVVITWARTSDTPGAKGISCFLVPGGSAGLSFGSSERKMGLNASHTVPLHYDRVEVGEEAVFGEVGRGFRLAMIALDGGRIGISAQSLGMATRALDEVLNAAQSDALFGSEVKSHQGLRFELAAVGTELDAAWLMTLRAARLKDAGEPFSLEAAKAKVCATETANRVIRRMHRVGSQYGLACLPTLERLLRDCRVTQIYEGTSEIQRHVIARCLLADAA